MLQHQRTQKTPSLFNADSANPMSQFFAPNILDQINAYRMLAGNGLALPSAALGGFNNPMATSTPNPAAYAALLQFAAMSAAMARTQSQAEDNSHDEGKVTPAREMNKTFGVEGLLQNPPLATSGIGALFEQQLMQVCPILSRHASILCSAQ